MTAYAPARPAALGGLSILAVRPLTPSETFRDALEQAGASVLFYPLIDADAEGARTPVQRAIDCLDTFDEIIFSGPNSARHALALIHASRDIPAAVRIGAVGASTLAALTGSGYAGRPLTLYDQEALAELKEGGRQAGHRCLIIRAQAGKSLLGEMIAAAGAEVVHLQVQENSPLKPCQAEALFHQLEDGVDAVTVANLDAWNNLLGTLPRDRHPLLERAWFVAGNARIARAIQAAGFPRVTMARYPTPSCMLKALEDLARGYRR